METLDLKSFDIFFLVFSLTNKDSFTKLDSNFMQKLKANLNTDDKSAEKYDQLKTEKTVFIVGNKSDLVDEREVDHVLAETYAKENNGHYMEISCITGENFDQLFDTAMKIQLKKKQDMKRENSGGGNCCVML